MPWKIKKIAAEKRWYHHSLLWVGAILLICGVFLALPWANRHYQRWSEHRHIGRAIADYNRRDYKQAILDAKGTLKINPKNVEAARVMAKALEALNAPGAVELRRQMDAVDRADPENLLAIAKHALQAGDLEATERTLKNVPPGMQKSARFYDLSAELALRRGDETGAQMHWREAMQLDPNEDDYRVKLDGVLLRSRSETDRSAALTDLAAVATRAAQRPAALRLLLADAVAHGDRERVKQLSDELGGDPKAPFIDRLARLAALHAVHDPAADPALKELQEAAAGDPKNVMRLMSWMIDHQLALLVPEWTYRLPAEMISAPPVCVVVAEAMALGSDWKALQTQVEGAQWKEFEFLRWAYLARALDHLGNASGAEGAWDKALSASQARAATLELLGKTALGWGWTRRADVAFWRLSSDPNCPRWVAHRLWAIAEKSGNTIQLYNASRVLLNLDPKSVKARNNFIALALLTGQTTDSPRELAVKLHEEAPGDATVTSTYAFSLYQQGRVEEAVQVMKPLPEDIRRRPDIALYFGVFLAAAGEDEQAGEYLELGARARQLPEEAALSEYLRVALWARGREQTGDSSSAAAGWEQAVRLAPPVPEASELLGKMALRWGWSAQAEALLLELAKSDRCPSWGRARMWPAAVKTADSATIYRAAALLHKLEPLEATSQGRFLRVSLLHPDADAASEHLAEEAHRRDPGNVECGVSAAFALIQQGKADQALPLLRTLKPAPIVTFYLSLALACTGDEAAAGSLQGAVVELPEEKALVQVLKLALQARATQRTSGQDAVIPPWQQAVQTALARPDWLVLLAGMARKWELPKWTEAALWPAAESIRFPSWAAEFLWTAALARGTAPQRLKASKILYRRSAENFANANRYITLALLDGDETDAPQRLAETLAKSNPASADAAATWALALYLHGQSSEALKVLEGLKPGQLREARPAFYRGILLAAAGQRTAVEEWLKNSSAAALLPEEMALLAASRSASAH